jgi:hypothetical protein
MTMYRWLAHAEAARRLLAEPPEVFVCGVAAPGEPAPFDRRPARPGRRSAGRRAAPSGAGDRVALPDPGRSRPSGRAMSTTSPGGSPRTSRPLARSRSTSWDGASIGRGRRCAWPEHLFGQRSSPSFRCKFSLHPGLWHVLTFRHMLEALRSSLPEVRSIRAFEGAMHGACRSLGPLLLERTYRVRGDDFAARGRWFESRGCGR